MPLDLAHNHVKLVVSRFFRKGGGVDRQRIIDMHNAAIVIKPCDMSADGTQFIDFSEVRFSFVIDGYYLEFVDGNGKPHAFRLGKLPETKSESDRLVESVFNVLESKLGKGE